MKIIKSLDNTNGILADFDLLNSTDADLKNFVKNIPEHHFILLKNVPFNFISNNAIIIT